MRSGKWVLFTAWISAILMLVLITIFNQAKVDKFIGLTSNKEHVINFPYPIEISKTFVFSGEEVKKGDLLAKLSRSDLAKDIDKIDSRVNELLSLKSNKLEDIKADMKTLEVTNKLQIEKLNIQIKEESVKLKNSKKLLETVIDVDDGAFSDLKYKIKILKNERQSKQKLYKTKKIILEKELKNETKSYEVQIDRFLKQKKELRQKEQMLTVYAPIDGEIGSISYGKNSLLKSYEKLLTIHTKYPEFATGYIHEDIINSLKVGQRVAVEAFNKTDSSKKMVYGTIESIENRIEEIPVKLKKYKIVPLWGYKVLISLPKNDFQLGKKVMISSSFDKSFLEKNGLIVMKFLNLN